MEEKKKVSGPKIIFLREFEFGHAIYFYFTLW
jgi:hypothetical protein